MYSWGGFLGALILVGILIRERTDGKFARVRDHDFTCVHLILIWCHCDGLRAAFPWTDWRCNRCVCASIHIFGCDCE